MFRYFKFKLNDTVQFAERDSHLYRIVGYRLERSGHEEWAYVVYELLRDFDGYMVDAEEAELVKVVEVEGEYYKIQNKCGYTYPVKIKPVQPPAPEPVQPERRIDELLDAYNDYKRLAALFNDLSYETKAEEVLGKMRYIQQ
ncbi:histidinol dehydrogenase [Ectobacillus ponti]|uniref:Histidinol dehydrogenase n=1 Tax=Ectobacillus ponti TaxID=2961894 RepID=A0AA41X3W1_9BACI|nr:histidinol dehydrogenase [Ectobacillus ponti]MCP8968474.1 histidinol dehydrogenase [Ectobacillus ponti]